MVQLVDQLHVAEHRGIAGVINLHATFEFDHIPAGLAGVDHLPLIFDPAGMKGRHHGDAHVAHRLRAATIHSRAILHAFFLQPGADLVHRDHRGLMFLGDLDRVAHVVEMPVADEHHVHRF